MPLLQQGQVKFTTMRQELLTKPLKQSRESNKDAIQVVECTWNEPFVLYYDNACDEDEDEESLLKFTIQMAYDDLTSQPKK